MTKRIEIHTGNTDTHKVSTRIELGSQKWIKIWIENKHGMWIKILDSDVDQILDRISNQNLDRNLDRISEIQSQLGDDFHA